MKRLVCLLLCGMVLLAGCQTPAVTPETPTTAAVSTTTTTATTTSPTTTTMQPPTTTTTISREQELQQIYHDHIQTFLQAWKAGDGEGLVRYTGSQEVATLLAEGVTVDSYEVGPLTADNPRKLTLSVSDSRVPSIPVGESRWWIHCVEYDGYYVVLCPIDEDYTARWSKSNASDSLAVWFCYEMATELKLFDTVKDYSRMSPAELGAKGGTLMRIFNGWRKATEENPSLPYERTVPEMSWFAERVLGVTVTDFSASPDYLPATESGEAMVELSFPGGLWSYAGLVDHTERDGVHTVTLCFYADITRLVEAVTVRYTVRHQGDGTFRLLSSQRLSGGTYPPVMGAT